MRLGGSPLWLLAVALEVGLLGGGELAGASPRSSYATLRSQRRYLPRPERTHRNPGVPTPSRLGDEREDGLSALPTPLELAETESCPSPGRGVDNDTLNSLPLCSSFPSHPHANY